MLRTRFCLSKTALAACIASLYGVASLAQDTQNSTLENSADIRNTVTQSKAQNNAESLAKIWHLTPDEWRQYESIMSGPRGYWSPGLDPLTAIGIHAESEQQRRHMAELFVMQEQERVDKELAFQREVSEAWKRLFPGPLMVTTPDPLATAFNKPSDPENFISGDEVLFIVDKTCAGCSKILSTLISEISHVSGLKLAIFVQAATDDEIRELASLLEIPRDLVQSGRISLHHDNGLLAKISPKSSVPVLFRKRGDQLAQLDFD